MHYEEKWMDGWLCAWVSPHGQWDKVPEKQMIARMRHALELVLEATDFPEHRRSDVAWLRGTLLAARGAALTALEPRPARAPHTTINPRSASGDSLSRSVAYIVISSEISLPPDDEGIWTRSGVRQGRAAVAA